VGSFFDSPEHLRAPTGADVLLGREAKIPTYFSNALVCDQFFQIKLIV